MKLFFTVLLTYFRLLSPSVERIFDDNCAMIKLRFGFTSLPLSDQRTWGKVVYLDNYRNKSKVLVLSMSKVMDSDKTHMTIIKAMSLDIVFAYSTVREIKETVQIY